MHLSYMVIASPCEAAPQGQGRRLENSLVVFIIPPKFAVALITCRSHLSNPIRPKVLVLSVLNTRFKYIK